MTQFDPDRLARIETWMARYVAEARYPGCSVLIHNRGQEVYFAATGQRDLAEDKPFTRDTLTRIYSMTKPVTSVVLMSLIEEGLCPLHTPVSEFIPAFATCNALIPGAARIDQTEVCTPPTLAELLTHTSGLSYSFNGGLLGEAMDAEKIMFAPGQETLPEMTQRLADLPLAFPPGAKWNYSVGIDVIGRVIEVMTGKPLSQVFQERVFDPLGMIHTSFTVPDELRDQFAVLYTSTPGEGLSLGTPETPGVMREIDRLETSPFVGSQMYSGGGGLLSTIDDYMRFAEMIRTGGKGIIGPATLEFMLRNHLEGDIASMGPDSFAEQPMRGMGFGLGGAVVLDPALSGMPGSIGDFSWGGIASTFFWVDRVRDFSVVFMTQLTPSSSYPARAELKALVHAALA